MQNNVLDLPRYLHGAVDEPKFWPRLDDEEIVRVPKLGTILEVGRDFSFEINKIIC